MKTHSSIPIQILQATNMDAASSKRERERLLEIQVERALWAELLAEVQDLLGNIRVFCRVRPLHQHGASKGIVIVGEQQADELMQKQLQELTNPKEEKEKKKLTEAEIEQEKAKIIQHRKDTVFTSIYVEPLEANKYTQTFTFEKVFTPNTTQQNVFNELESLLVSVQQGRNVCILAYGQTGSGKTYTMNGPPKQPELGLYSLTLQSLFNRIVPGKQHISITIVQVYLDKAYDLMDENTLQIARGIEDNGSVKGITPTPVQTHAQVLQYLTQASKRRETGNNDINMTSSRSHMVLTIYVNQTDKSQPPSKLRLIDLAGSEKPDLTISPNATYQEMQKEKLKFEQGNKINQSLSNLRATLMDVRRRGEKAIFRKDTLTRMLKDSLGAGKSKVIMFIHVHSSAQFQSDTINTLKWADMTQGI